MEPYSAEKIHAYALLDNGRKVNITPAVTWSVDNPDILEAVDGYIFSLDAGEAEVTGFFGDPSGSLKMNVAE